MNGGTETINKLWASLKELKVCLCHLQICHRSHPQSFQNKFLKSYKGKDENPQQVTYPAQPPISVCPCPPCFSILPWEHSQKRAEGCYRTARSRVTTEAVNWELAGLDSAPACATDVLHSQPWHALLLTKFILCREPARAWGAIWCWETNKAHPLLEHGTSMSRKL